VRIPDSKQQEVVMSFANIDEVLDLAFSREEEAAALCVDLAGRVERSVTRKAFLEFAKEEKMHTHRFEVDFDGGSSRAFEPKFWRTMVGQGRSPCVRCASSLYWWSLEPWPLLQIVRKDDRSPPGR
jgi:hypothetical protein